MLKGIPPIISPKLMKILMEMGHGDEIVLADGNFPASSNAHRLVRCDGHSIPDLLQAIMLFFPLDKSADRPARGDVLIAGRRVSGSLGAISNPHTGA